MTGELSTPGRTPHGAGTAVVVGGGVAGLGAAWRLARAGLEVTVVDPGEPHRRSTWAAGGMLAPLGEAREPGPFLAMGLRSLSLYPDFAADLEAASGIPLGLHLNGKLLTAATAEDVSALTRRREWLEADGHAVEWLDGAEARRLEPALAPDIGAGLLLVGNGRVDNRALQAALEIAAERAGAARVADRVTRIVHRAGRAAGVQTAGGRSLGADWIVLAAGAWSGEVEGLPRDLPVRPVKGQMLAFSTPDRPLDRVVISPRAYLIPRETPSGPVVVVGATSEDAGFDLGLSAAGQEGLEAGAKALVPRLVERPVVERWAGLRPGSPDDLPVLGPDPEMPGLVYATGHYRNGVLLAPGTARAVEGWVTGSAPAGLEAFSPGRFAVR